MYCWGWGSGPRQALNTGLHSQPLHKNSTNQKPRVLSSALCNLSMVVHTCGSSASDQKFIVTLSYIVTSRPAWATRETTSKKRKKRNKRQMKATVTTPPPRPHGEMMKCLLARKGLTEKFIHLLNVCPGIN